MSNTFETPPNSWEKINSGEAWEGSIDFISDGNLRERVRQIVISPDKLIGKGGAGMVFDLEDGRCIKLVKNRHRDPEAYKYDLGNSVEEELRIQNILKDLEVEGVFAPRVVGYYEGMENAAIVMEQLKAVDLQMVVNGKKELPKDFDIDTFFEKLEDYIDEMHQLGVVHLDLNPKNIMVDIETAEPRLIDFGRSKHFKNEITDKNVEFKRLTNKDFESLEKSRNIVATHIDKLNK